MVPQNLCIRENPIYKWMIIEVPPFQEYLKWMVYFMENPMNMDDLGILWKVLLKVDDDLGVPPCQETQDTVSERGFEDVV